MPKIDCAVIHADESVSIGLWRVTESQDDMLGMYPELRLLSSEYERYKSCSRRMEFLVERALLKEMLKEMPVLSHTASGKPFLSDGRKVSVSHTKGLVAIIVSDTYEVAVDVEYLSGRVCRIAEKFLRHDEEAPAPLQKLLGWCAKETMFKLHSDDNLNFHEMRIPVFPNVSIGSNGTFVMENLKSGKRINVEYVVDGGHLLTYAVDKTF